MSRLVTFYSYKGGVGRTFSVANIAVLLAKRGKKVLVMDWDLEAPGLHRYFMEHLKPKQDSKGLIHLLCEVESSQNANWRSYRGSIAIPECPPFDIITSGDSSSDYAERIRGFSWTEFFGRCHGGEVLDRWRQEWKSEYDFVLIDSRTGLTDTGGICTIYLPDILALVFSANEQSFGCGVQIARSAQIARQKLEVPRAPLAVLPLPGRFDGRDELNEAKHWLDRFADELKIFYDDWLPKSLHPKQILELTKIPYITKFSFGEPLPVVSQGITDPEFPGFYFENIAKLLASDFEDAKRIVDPEAETSSTTIAKLFTLISSKSIDENKVAECINIAEQQLGNTGKYADLLTEIGGAFFRQQRFKTAEMYIRHAVALNDELRGRYDSRTRSATNLLAEVLRTNGKISESERLYRSVVEHTKEDDDASLSASINLGEIARMTGRPNEAIEWFKRTLDGFLRQKIEDRSPIVTLYVSIANVCREMSRFEEASSWYLNALNEIPESRRIERATILSSIASLHKDNGRPEISYAWYKNALNSIPDSTSRDDPAFLAILSGLASACREMGRLDDAIKWHKVSLEGLTSSGWRNDPTIISIYNSLGDLYLELGQYEKAVEWYSEVPKAARPSDRHDNPLVTSAYIRIADVHRMSGNTKEAIQWYERALRTSTSAKRSDRSIFSAYNHLAALYRDLGESGEAIRWYQRALESYEVVGPHVDLTILATLGHLSETLMHEGRLRDAETYLRRALKIGSGTPDGGTAPEMSRIHGMLAQILRRTGRPAETYSFAPDSSFDAFIAYSQIDKNIVKEIVDGLLNRGLRVWYDEWELRPGELVKDCWTRGIASSGAVLACVGKLKYESWMIREISTVVTTKNWNNVYIIPILLPGADPSNVPDMLKVYSSLDLRDSSLKDRLDRLGFSLVRNRRPSEK